ncbi:MAG: hypothetical protein Q8N26_36575 [Myxococcales bacterium]|nr:hypothetical protein [Myxococcales bacterium]
MRAVLVLVLMVVATACDTTVQAGGCGPGSCTGCCTSSGECVSGIEPASCGSVGMACMNCSLSGFTCQLGQCVQPSSFSSGGGAAGTGGGLATGGGASGACGSSSCAGCCSEGRCSLGVFDDECGSRGTSCTTCGDLRCSAFPRASDGSAQGGRCVTTGAGGGGASTCSVATCPTGCCDANGACQRGVTTSACGTVGAACTSCGESTVCVNGACVGGQGGGAGGGAASCSAASCPRGCCSGSGVCMEGSGSASCGSGGAQCSTCAASEICVSGVCTADPDGGQGGGFGGGGASTGGGFASGGGGASTGGGFASGGGGASTGGGFAGGGGASTGGGFAGGGASTGGGFAGGGASTGGGFAGGGASSGGGFAGGGTSTGGGVAGGATAGGTAGGVVSGNGETCAAAIVLTSPGSRSGTLTGALNDYGSGSACLSAPGPDRVYRLQVGMAARVSVTVTPTASWDVSVSATVGSLARCAAAPRTCDAAVDAATAGNSETIDVATAGDDVFVVVDSASTSVGGFTLSWNISPLAVGDRCEAPYPLQSGVARTDTTFGFTNDYTAGFSCAAFGRLSADVVYAIQVGPGQGLDVRVTPQGAMLDTSISIATAITSCSSQCVAGANTGAGGVADVAFWNNVSGSTVTAYVIVDSSQGSSPGPFTITATVGAQVTCNPSRCPTGCCLNNQCVGGAEDTACGQQGNACQVCGQYQQCQSAACVDAPRPTGAPCSMASQCYSGTFSPATCRATWPNGGYCSGTCLLDGYDCGGLPIIGPGFCVSGVCLQKCSSPGTGQSTCRADYVCEVSGGVGSQGICLPRCQQIPCGSGTCQPSGYCR